MISNCRWGYYSVRSKLRWKYIRAKTEEKYYQKPHRYAGRIVLTNDDTSLALRKAIIAGEPYMAGRFGLSEMYVMRSFECDIDAKKKESLTQLCKWSGFFPNEEKHGERFLSLMKESCSQVDYLAVGYQSMEEFYIRKYMSEDVTLAEFRCIEPWYGGTPWTSALRGKKVLVIHPFSETIESQYAKREMLFSDSDMLPEFHLITQKAVQTVAGTKDSRFSTWFDALDFMYAQAMLVDFDIALIGCGAYGFPLAAMLKKAGKQAIHMGGMLQVLFGIKGKRWDDDPLVSKFYNEDWTRPSESERPASSEVVENGCYW